MARLFDDVAGDVLSADAAAVTAMPFTMACWFRSDDTTTAQILMFLGDKDVSDQNYLLLLSGNVAGDPVRFRGTNGATAPNAATTTGYSANTWHHAAGVATSATDREVFIDGGSRGTSTTSVTPTGLDRTAIGKRNHSAPDFSMSGRIAEAAIWSVALSDAEIALLAGGVNPQRIQRQSLAGYWPIYGNGSPEPNYAGDTALNLTVTGAVVADGPPRMMAPFGFWTGWDGGFTAVVVAGQPTMRRWGHVLHMPTTAPRMAGIR